jgi:putative addiction module component (TIGR02574 family)
MDLTALLEQIRPPSVDDRIRLVHAIWDTIIADPDYPDLTEAQKRELDRRIADLEANPDNVLTWEEIRAQVPARS